MWCHSVLSQSRAKKDYQPEWNTPYFVQLRERMIPSNSAAAIVDAETRNDSNSIKNSAKKQLITSTLKKQRIELHELAEYLPSETKLIAYEWFSRHPWSILNFSNDWGMVSNQNQQQELIQKLKENRQHKKQHNLAICVSSEHVADRGALRFFSNLSEYAELHLLIFEFAANKQIKRRWAEWLHFAEQLTLKQEQVVIVDARQTEKLRLS